MNLSHDEWKMLEKRFRALTKRWASYYARLLEDSTEHQARLHDYERLAASADSPSSLFAEFEQRFTGRHSLEPGIHEWYVMELAQEFAEISARYRKPQRFLNDATRLMRIELNKGPKFDRLILDDKDLKIYEDFIKEHMPFGLPLIIDHAFYALYVAWQPESRIIIPDNRPMLLRALGDDESLFRAISPRQFEELIAYIYECLGCKVELTKASRDYGADVLAWHAAPFSSDLLIAVQVKKYASYRKVTLKHIFELHGAVTHYHAVTGHVITSSNFTKPAKDFAEINKYNLIDLQQLQREIHKLFDS